MPTQEYMRETLSDVLRDYDIREAYVYGSYARGEQTEQSDIDLRFLCGSTMNFATLLDIQEELERRFGKSLDIATSPPSEMRPSFYNRIKQDEVLLYAAN